MQLHNVCLTGMCVVSFVSWHLDALRDSYSQLGGYGDGVDALEKYFYPLPVAKPPLFKTPVCSLVGI
jgi:hypothetical protein